MFEIYVFPRDSVKPGNAFERFEEAFIHHLVGVGDTVPRSFPPHSDPTTLLHTNQIGAIHLSLLCQWNKLKKSTGRYRTDSQDRLVLRWMVLWKSDSPAVDLLRWLRYSCMLGLATTVLQMSTSILVHVKSESIKQIVDLALAYLF